MRPAFKLYAKHLAIAWPGLFLATSLLGVLLDRTAVNYLFDFPNSAPYFAGYWLVGALAGYWLNRTELTRVAEWTWVPPLALLSLSFRSDLLARSGGWAIAWANYFTPGCTGSECLGELLFTGPFITCAAYSFGAWWARRRGEAAARTPARSHPDDCRA